VIAIQGYRMTDHTTDHTNNRYDVMAIQDDVMAIQEAIGIYID
jgi:hypothetical protein